MSIKSILKKIDIDTDRAIISNIKSGVNSDIYKIKLNDQKLILKVYPRKDFIKRDRLNSELNFLNLLVSGGFENIPKPLNWDHHDKWLLMTFLEGESIKNIQPIHYEKLFEFIFNIQSLNSDLNINKIKNASEAEFTVLNHFVSVNNRVNLFMEKIELYQYISDENKVLIKIILNKLKIRMKYIKDFELTVLSDINNKEVIYSKDKILSQSDIGFHNIFKDQSNNLLFFDFEYAGWDHTLKMISDIILQPDNRMQPRYFYLLDRMINRYIVNINDQNKLCLVCMIYRIKWTCIILNNIFKKPYDNKFFLNQIDELIKKANQYYEESDLQEKSFISFLKENYF